MYVSAKYIILWYIVNIFLLLCLIFALCYCLFLCILFDFFASYFRIFGFSHVCLFRLALVMAACLFQQIEFIYFYV